MSKTKKVNPSKVPATRAEVKRAYRQGQSSGVNLAMAIIFYAMVDKYDVGKEAVRELWGQVEYTSDSVKKGYLDLADMVQLLSDEYGIEFNLLDDKM